MAAKLRLWRVPDFEKYKKVRNLLQKSEKSEHFGGPEETRTLDLSDANRTLSQLSYRPIFLSALRRKLRPKACIIIASKALFVKHQMRGFLRR